MDTAEKTVTATTESVAEKTYRMTDLLFDRGWSRKMIKGLLVPDRTEKRGKQDIHYYRESQVLEAERKVGHTPVQKTRPPKRPYVKTERLSKSMEKSNISSLPIEVQARIVHLQTLVPFYSPNDLTKQAVEAYNQKSLQERRPLIGTKISPRQVIEIVKIKFLLNRVVEIKPTANKPEILKAIKLVYPYLADGVDDQIKAICSPRRKPVRRPTLIAKAS